MAELIFRDLRADEIDCRVATINQKGVSLLLYKDARCDMNILDETVGAFNWQRQHTRDNANCIVSIWDEDHGRWVSKEDVGTESNTEAAKGLASDSFKRACFNWGIGRELYTAPFIWFKLEKCSYYTKNDGKLATYDKFRVNTIVIEDKKIRGLSIINMNSGEVVYTYGKAGADQGKAKKGKKKAEAETAQEPVEKTYRQKFKEYVTAKGLESKDIRQILIDCGLQDNSIDEDWKIGYQYAIALFGELENEEVQA